MIDASTRCLADISCTELKGVGPKIALTLKKLNIHSIQDLLFHLPLRYEDRSTLKDIKQLRLGDQVWVTGEILSCEIQQSRRRSLICRIQDETGSLLLRFFNFNATQKDYLRTGKQIYCYGEIRRGVTGYEMIHPEYRLLKEPDRLPLGDQLTPIYPATEGINQLVLRRLIDQALDLMNENQLEEFLPDCILQRYNLPSLLTAVRFVHRPPASALLAHLNQGQHQTQRRLAFEELLAHQLSLAQLRLRARRLKASAISYKATLIDQFLSQLSFRLTVAQQRVVNEICQDMSKPYPMLRLVQGDVGSGKTVVAAIAALCVIANGLQVALMAPTELLAEQHCITLKRWFMPLAVEVDYLAGGLSAKDKMASITKLASGGTHVIVGTHALFQEGTSFKNLGLVIVDEQHRFGVDQRLSLLNKGTLHDCQPHQLIMSATPIPRTLSMTAYGDLDCSIIDELPPGRTPIKTVVLPQTKREALMERIRVNCQQGAQVYWVCTLIEESEVLQCQAAEDVAKELTDLLPELRVGLIHGRMKAKEKELTMQAFKEQAIDVLVATTVIEVGVDVPNASLMIIENAERLGLAQLHQLRGRVGRGTTISYCVLLYQSPLSKLAEQRLGVLRDSTDGFIIAQKDLELRGPGEILGKKQTGLVQLRIANLIRDQEQLPCVQEAARFIAENYPDQSARIIVRWLADNYRFTEV